MGQIEDLQVYVSIVEAGSMGKAAAALSIAKSAVSRRLAILENRFQTSLIDRSPGNWALTAQGHALYARARTLIEEAEALTADFSDQRLVLTGPLNLSLPRDFGLGRLNMVLQRFAHAYPEITLNLSFDDRLVDLEHENFHAAIRITANAPHDVQADLLAKTQAHLVASPDYLASSQPINSPTDLMGHRFLAYGGDMDAQLKFKGQQITIRPEFHTNSGIFLAQMTLGGCGVAVLPEFLITQSLKDQKLVKILPNHPLSELGIYFCKPKAARRNRRLDLFWDFLCKNRDEALF